MNFEIKKESWSNFFDSLSRRRFEWITKVEVLKGDIGDQILTDGLPLNGITVEVRGDRTTIDISVGENTDAHQTHNIENPARVAFLAADDDHGDVINIEEDDGTKTLITFIEPMSIIAGYAEGETVASAA
ncbi:MAG: DUF5335 family protein [Pyrinomonadaceae bacterium]